jgi:hypothetical protein
LTLTADVILFTWAKQKESGRRARQCSQHRTAAFQFCDEDVINLYVSIGKKIPDRQKNTGDTGAGAR